MHIAIPKIKIKGVRQSIGETQDRILYNPENNAFLLTEMCLFVCVKYCYHIFIMCNLEQMVN